MSVEPIKGVLSVYTNPLYGTLASELIRGYSAYNIAVMEGYEGTIDEWLASLVGPKGDKGDKGDPGLNGEQGPRGYTGETGATGPKGDKGDKGETGNGIYAVVLRADYTLSIYFTDGSVYNTPSIRGREGAVGPTGPIGPQGETGAKGDKGDTGDAGTGISSIIQNADHSLTINLDDGTSYTTDPVEALKGDKGDTGNGISSIVMKSDYTLQINMTNGTSYSTPSIRGIQGETGPKGDTGATGPKGDKGDPGALNFHICSQSEYDATTRVPTVHNPEEDTFYLVPSASVTSPDLFVEWIYVNNAWEMFGSATVVISGKADKVTNATSGNFAGLDSNGNLTDSGHNFTEINQELTSVKETLSDLESYTKGGLYEDDVIETQSGYTIDITTGKTKTGSGRRCIFDFMPIKDATYIEIVCTDSSHSSATDQGYKIYEYSDASEASYLGGYPTGTTWYWTDQKRFIYLSDLQYSGDYIRLVFYSTLEVTVKVHYAGRTTGGLLSRIETLESTSATISDVTNLETQVDDMAEDLINVKESLAVNSCNNIAIGSISGSDGTPSESSTRVRTDDYIVVKSLWYCDTRDTAYNHITFMYDANKAYIGRIRTGFYKDLVNREILKRYPTAVYVKFAFSKDTSGNMTDADIKNVKSLVRIYHDGDSDVIDRDTVVQNSKEETIIRINNDYFSKNYIKLEIGSIKADTGSNSSSTIRLRTSDMISVSNFVCCNISGKSYTMIYYLYDANGDFLHNASGYGFENFDLTKYGIITSYPDAAFVRIVFSRSDNANITDADIANLRTAIFLTDNVRKVDVDKARFDYQFNYVAYSRITPTDAPINTEEHFIYCANTGKFTALKGDVRNTADGGLIMCHDAGFTFDSNNKITSYNTTNNTPIDTLTVAECKALAFATQWENKDCHPCDFETFVRVCKKHGLIAYVTVRDEHIADVVAPEVLRILKLYRMLDRAIVNSFTKSTLEIFRALNSSITLSLVLGNKYIPTTADVDYVVSLGNCNLNLFNVPVDSSVPGTNVEDKLENLLSGSEYASVLEYAHSKNVVLYDAQTGNAAPDVLLRHGIVGAHMTVVPDFDWKRS